jgi:ABC-type nitrate/sulfonate/bicarbonate transport system permease component
MSEIMEYGLAGTKRGRPSTVVLKVGSIVGFLVIWTLISTIVEVYGLMNPIFLPSPWTVFGKILDM